MLNPRNIIILVFVLAGLKLFGIVLELVRPPDGNGLGQDSYGTYAHGYRGLYDVLKSLKISVEHGLAPPPLILRPQARLVMLAPRKMLVRSESAYLGQIGEWVREGGRLAVAPARNKETAPDQNEKRSEHDRDKEDRPPDVEDFLSTGTLFDAVGLAGVTIKTAGLEGATQGDGHNSSEEEIRQWTDVQAVAQGELAFLSDGVRRLDVPLTHLQEIAATTATLQPVGRVLFYDDAGASHTIAALYPLGRGRVAVVSDPDLLSNRALARHDNAILAVGLLTTPGGGPVIFDEFYHGLSIRGNPLWLLTRAPYRLLLLALVLGAACWAWRGSVALGPPRPEPAVPRRTVAEYIDAMASLFHRSGHHRFMLGELRDGMLWWLRQRLHLAQAQENAEAVIRALERTDPAAAARLGATLADTDRLLSDRRTVSKKHTLRIAQRMMEWLWMNSTQKSAAKSRASFSVRTK